MQDRNNDQIQPLQVGESKDYYNVHPKISYIMIALQEMGITMLMKYANACILDPSIKNDLLSSIIVSFKDRKSHKDFLKGLSKIGISEKNYNDAELSVYSNPSPCTSSVSLCLRSGQKDKLVEFVSLLTELDLINEEIYNDIIYRLQLPAASLEETMTKKLIALLESHGYEHTLSHIRSFPYNQDNAILLLGNILHEQNYHDEAIECYKLIASNQSSKFYKQANLQLANLYYTTKSSSDFNNPREHAALILPYYHQAKDEGNAPDMCSKLFQCLCSNSYNLEQQTFINYPSGAKLDSVFEIADFVYSSNNEIARLKRENEKLRQQSQFKQEEPKNKKDKGKEIEEKEKRHQHASSSKITVKSIQSKASAEIKARSIFQGVDVDNRETSSTIVRTVFQS